jgi:DNA mismatch endonuclease, patch repair protein
MKIGQNQERDRGALEKLQSDGWRIGQVWECALKGRTKLPETEVLDRCEAWLRSREASVEVCGSEDDVP